MHPTEFEGFYVLLARNHVSVKVMFMLIIDSCDPEFDIGLKNASAKVLVSILCLTIKVVHPTEAYNIFVIDLICFNMHLHQKTLRGRIRYYFLFNDKD